MLCDNQLPAKAIVYGWPLPSLQIRCVAEMDYDFGKGDMWLGLMCVLNCAGIVAFFYSICLNRFRNV